MQRPSITSVDVRYSRRAAILEKNLAKSKPGEVSLSSLSFLFSEILQYTQNRVHGIQDLERKYLFFRLAWVKKDRLNEIGYRVGIRSLELIMWREKNIRRETRILGVLYFINTTVWRTLFGKQADSLEKSTEHEDEYMISDNDPMVSKYISIPKELNQLNCAAFIAGIVEAVLDGCQFPARVTAHSVPIEGNPYRTTILIKFERDVIEREEKLK